MVVTQSRSIQIDNASEESTSTITTLDAQAFPSYPVARVHSVASGARMSAQEPDRVRSYYARPSYLASMTGLFLYQPELITIEEQHEELSPDDIAVYRLPNALTQRARRDLHFPSHMAFPKALSTSIKSISERLSGLRIKAQELEIEDASDTEDIEPFWRDTFAFPSSSELIFSQKIEVDIDKLPPWKPHIEIDNDRLEDDEERCGW